MTKQEALEIIERENLHGYNFDGENIHSNEAGILFRDNKWTVYEADEKAKVRMIAGYDLKDEAYSHVIDCLRINNRFEERHKREK